MFRSTTTLFALAGMSLAQAPFPSVPMRPIADPEAAPAVSEVREVSPSRDIDLVLCLDVSGSMQGLIDSARQNLWSIVNDMATLQPQPRLRVALLTYGSPLYGKGSGFVSIQTGLTDDLDLVSQKLFALSTNGGSEYVARVVKRSLDDLEWSKDQQALKLIFVAGNEPATQDPQFAADEMAKRAIQRGILVNTIFCGSQQKPEVEGWRHVARLADGKFTAIEHNQQVVIETPFDKQLRDLSTQLNSTYVVYGANRVQWAANQVAQDRNAATLNLGAVAQRCQTKAGNLYHNPRYDLVDACKDPKFVLTSVKTEHLPEALQKMTVEELKAHVDGMAKKRGAIQKQVAEIGKQRDAFVLAERKKLAGKGEKLFEEAMLESVRAQARSRGFERRAPSVVEKAEPEEPVQQQQPVQQEKAPKAEKKAPQAPRKEAPAANVRQAGKQVRK
jgi:hypothetical protein